jgi:endoglucanase
MELKEFLARSTALTGLPGFERPVSEFVASVFEPLVDDVSIDVMENVIARLGDAGPRVMISAHQDEIGLMVSLIEDDGCLRMARNGGVDPRILPGLEVSVLTEGGPLFGVIGAKPPHLLAASDYGKALSYRDLFIDIGFKADAVRERVRIGDPIVMLAPPVELANGRYACKTMDDRAGIAVMLECLSHMKKMRMPAQVFFVSSVQEEIGLKGAKTAAYALDPDFAIAIDVTHGAGPGTGPFEAYALDSVALSAGPNLHPVLLAKLRDTAKRNHVDVVIDVCPGVTGTDAGAINIARAGIPCALIEVPLRYMHTTVETLSLDTIREAGRLMALFIGDMAREWEGIKWF